MKIALPAICFAALVVIPSLAVGKPLQMKRVKLRDAFSSEILCSLYKMFCPTPKPTRAPAPVPKMCKGNKSIGVNDFLNELFTASSTWDQSSNTKKYSAWNAKLNKHTSGWAPFSWGNIKEYLQLNLRYSSYVIREIGIQGSYQEPNDNSPPTILDAFYVKFSKTDKDEDFKFPPKANHYFSRAKKYRQDSNAEDKIIFPVPFIASYIRIYPDTSIGQIPAVRLELYGCEL